MLEVKGKERLELSFSYTFKYKHTQALKASETSRSATGSYVWGLCSFPAFVLRDGEAVFGSALRNIPRNMPQIPKKHARRRVVPHDLCIVSTFTVIFQR